MISSKKQHPARIFTFLLILTISNHSHAGAPLGYVQVSGALNAGWDQRVVPILDGPGGTVIGGISLKRGLQWCLGRVTIKGKRILHHRTDTIRIQTCLHPAFYDQQDDYVRIMDNSLAGGAWLALQYSMPENPELMLTLKTTDIVNSITNFDTFEIRGFNGYQVFEKPDYSSEILYRLKEKTHLIIGFTGRRQGQWLEAIAGEMNNYPRNKCLSIRELDEYLISEKTGWINLFTEAGMLRKIRFEERRCR